MVIKPRPVISWMLNPQNDDVRGIILADCADINNLYILQSGLHELNNIRKQLPEWGLPELLTPSFEKVMEKSTKSFEKMMPELFKKFSEREECGILLCKGNVTIFYGFYREKLFIWYFTDKDKISTFHFYTGVDFEEERMRVAIPSNLIQDDKLFNSTIEQREDAIGSIANVIAIYVAVKYYGEVETIIVPEGKFTAVDGTPLEYVEKKKVMNMLGQKVIVMDSKWFREIINKNDIQVRGFFKMQHYKNDSGEWARKLIFIDPHIRHGYYRTTPIKN